MASTREKNFWKSTIILAFGTFLPKLTSFVTLPIYTACLTKSEYGTFDLITVLCSLLLPVATLQIQSAVYRFLLERRFDTDRINSVVTILYLFVIPVSVLVLGVTYFLLGKAISPYLKFLIVLYFFADILLVVTRQIARGLLKNHVYSTSAIINSFLNMVLVLVFLLLWDRGLIGLMESLVIATTVSFLYIFIALKIWNYVNVKQLNWCEFKEIINYSWPMVPNSVSLWVMRVSDRAIISLFLGVEANAIYAVANKIPTILQLAQNTFSMAWSESASLTVNDNDVTEYYSKMFRTLHRVMAGLAALMLACLPILFAILIKGDYDTAYIHIAILIVGMFFSNIAIYLGGIYVAYMKTKSIGWTTILAALLNAIINILFIRKIGIFAATLSTTLSYFFLMIYRLWDIQKFQKISIDIKETVFTDIVLIIMCIICIKRTMITYILNCFIGLFLCYTLNKDLIKKMPLLLLRKLKKDKTKI